MSIIVKLLIASLFSIHQYIPDEDTRYKKYFTDVREATPEDVIPAAHETCRYLISVFVDAGLEVTLGSSNNSFLSESLAGILGGDQELNSMLDVLTTGQFADKFAENNIDPEEVKTAVKNLCSQSYSPLSFKPEQRQELFDFIQSEINVLSDVHLNSLGDFNYFGSVNIFDRSGQTMGTLDAVPRAWMPYEQMSPHLTLALLATEDEDFFEHKGVDSKAIARIVKQTLSGDDATGGSTVTMQLLKNMYFLNGPQSQYEILNSGTFSTILRKAREWYWAWPYEKEHAKVLGDVSAKKYVLEMYYNLVDFGPRVQGVEQASFVYFSKSASQLDLAESAFITTLLKAPSRYSNPDNYVEYSEPRRNDYILTRAQAICERALDTSTQFKTVAVSDIYKKICTDGRTPINREYIQVAKDKALPFWMRPTTAPIATSLVLVRNQVDQWVKSFRFDPEKKPKEISVQTTISQPLQNVVFDVVRKKIDEYDAKSTPSVGNIGPANDDTGRKAQFRSTDIDVRLNSEINSIVSKIKDTKLKVFPSVKFRPTNLASSQTINFQDVTAYLMSLQPAVTPPTGSANSQVSSTPEVEATNAIPDVIIETLDTLEKQLLAQSKNVGDIYVVIFNQSEFSIKSIQNFITQDITATDAAKVTMNETVDRTKVRNRIITNALERMDRIKPRDYMRVGVISENGNLINAKLEEINLTESHRNRARRHSFGDFFWVRPQNKEDTLEAQNAGAFLLDTPKLQAAVMIMDANNGEVLANFGGYDPLASSFNRSNTAKRQAGSTLKPWIYYYALNKGFTPQTTLNNNYVAFEVPGRRQPYVPKNYSNSMNGNISFAQSLVNSQNIGTYSLLKNPIWGPDWRANLDDLRSFFEMITLYEVADKEVTIMLGSQVISIEKLVSSFSFFANGSRIANPQYVKYVNDYKGQKLFDLEPSYTSVPVFRPESIFQIQSLMAETANTGTAGRINNWVKTLSEGKYAQSCYNNVIGASKQTCFGGKTGTSNDAKDVWFIGVSKNFVIGVWVGYDDPRPIGGNATGGGLALPIFQDIVVQGEAHLPVIEPFLHSSNVPREFQPYSNYNSQEGNKCECVATNSGAAVNVTFDGIYYENFVADYLSLPECEIRKHDIVSETGRQVCP